MLPPGEAVVVSRKQARYRARFRKPGVEVSPMSKEAYRQKAEAKVEEYQAKLNEARARAKGASADARLEAEKQIGELEKKIDAGRQMLAGIGEAAEDAWEDLARGLDDAWDDVSAGIKKVIARIK
jgi:F0F1-type ATP synthase membrane subunit b/b'